MLNKNLVVHLLKPHEKALTRVIVHKYKGTIISSTLAGTSRSHSWYLNDSHVPYGVHYINYADMLRPG